MCDRASPHRAYGFGFRVVLGSSMKRENVFKLSLNNPQGGPSFQHFCISEVPKSSPLREACPQYCHIANPPFMPRRRFKVEGLGSAPNSTLHKLYNP